MKLSIRIFVACLLMVQSLPAQEKKLRVVTTLNYLKYVVEQVGGERVNVTALANPKQDPHYVTPTPRMNQIANDAELFIENGLNLDLWAKNVVDASGNPRIQPGNLGHLVATLSVPVKELPTEVSRAWGDIHPQGNPHVWLDPFNVKIIAANIADRLAKMDPANTEYYRQHLAAFEARLDAATFGEELLQAVGKKAGDILARKAKNQELIEWLKARNLLAQLGGWMQTAQRLNGLKIVSYHKTYVYFTDRFGLDIRSELEEKPGIPPPPQRRDAIVEQIKREGIKIILNDNFYSRDAADYVAGKTGAKVVVTYLDVGAAPELDTYEKLISYLIAEILQADA
ncbi:metal ABC transporter substrate-binding protein [candidate division KSB1 bacterium]|nr:metal ABC transporter substrate-binding protein [candidate division KSB1 bacterium]